MAVRSSAAALKHQPLASGDQATFKVGPGDGKLQRVEKQYWEGSDGKDGPPKTRVIVWRAVDEAKENRSILQHAQLKRKAKKMKEQAQVSAGGTGQGSYGG
eukprot:COSAG01_NODE_1256_length_11028_cov_10.728279_4_plen_101_part_00